MSGALKKWLVMNMMSYTIFVYVGIFVNLFIWEKHRLIFDVAWFNLLMFLTWAFAFAAAAHLLSRFTIRVLLGISAASGGTAFALLSFVELDNRLVWIACIGIPVGIMYGFFSAAQNLSVSMSGSSAELGHYFTAAGSIQQVVTLAVPLLSAIAIHYFGYSSTFVLMLVFLVVMLLFSFAMPKISLRAEIREVRPSVLGWYRSVVSGNPSLRWFSASNLAAGVFLQFQQLFLLIFTFSVTENKFWIAGLNALYTLATLLGLLAYRKLRLQDHTLLGAGCLLLACGFLIVLVPVKPVLIVSNLLTAVGMFCFGAAWNTMQFKLIKPYSKSGQAGLLVWRETLICVTRIATLLIVLSVESLRGPIFVGLIAISLLCLCAVPYFEYRAKKAMPAPEEQASQSAGNRAGREEIASV
ncbi:MFS transporter [Paenibacillus sp. GYB004]|uniref:MFS transporter n=1 Tax=Paenibacillus sp. GYB004 TaxID=2994393 RepID=UPI002F96B31F